MHVRVKIGRGVTCTRADIHPTTHTRTHGRIGRSGEAHGVAGFIEHKRLGRDAGCRRGRVEGRHARLDGEGSGLGGVDGHGEPVHILVRHRCPALGRAGRPLEAGEDAYIWRDVRVK